MENGTEADNPSPLDALHHDAIVSAGPIEQSPDGALEAGGDQTGGPLAGEDGGKEIAESTLACAFETLSETVHDHFYNQMAPVAGQAQAERIATRAAISPARQRLLTKSSVLVAEKHGALNKIGPEWMLAGGLLAWVNELRLARKDMRETLARIEAAKGAQ